jgi:hypothetical protein
LVLLSVLSGGSFPATLTESAFQGRVSDPEGVPIAGARIQVVDPEVARLCPDLHVGSPQNLWRAAGPGADERGDRGEGLSVRSDEKGRFELPARASAKSVVLIATAQGFAAHWDRVEAGQSASLVLERGSDLSLHLVTQQDERKVSISARQNSQVTLVLPDPEPE